MQDDCGKISDPGDYHWAQNYIAAECVKIERTRHVPPAPQEVRRLMDTLEEFLVGPYPDSLIQLALVHVEFDAIHPILDGNGRLARLLIPLFMKDKRILRAPNP